MTWDARENAMAGEAENWHCKGSASRAQRLPPGKVWPGEQQSRSNERAKQYTAAAADGGSGFGRTQAEGTKSVGYS